MRRLQNHAAPVVAWFGVLQLRLFWQRIPSTQKPPCMFTTHIPSTFKLINSAVQYSKTTRAIRNALLSRS